MANINIWPQLSPESQQAVEKSREQYVGFTASFTASSADPLTAMREGYLHERRYWNSFAVALASVTDLALDTAHGAVPTRLYKPSSQENLPVLLYAHGGGFMLGNLDTHDRICRLLAQKSGWAVLAIDYTLAPEKKFPVQADQVWAVLQHVAAQGQAMGLDPTRIALGGDSAGAHLSLGAALDAKAAGLQGVRALLLYYGAYGLKDSASLRLYGWADLDGLGDEDRATYQSCYTDDREHARVHLLKADMSGLPATFIGAVAFDPLRDDSLALDALMQGQGVTTQLKLYHGVLHSFLHYSALEPRAMQALEDGAAFLKSSV
jgi:acetyl esterase